MLSTLKTGDRTNLLNSAAKLNSQSAGLFSASDLTAPGSSQPTARLGRASAAPGSPASAPRNTLLLNNSLLKNTLITRPILTRPIGIVLPPIFVTDDTMATARNLGALSNSLRTTGSVGSNDTQDYFRFRVNGSSPFNLSLRGLSADADVQLLNSSGVEIASSRRGGTNDEAINLASLATGDYYIRVYQYSGNSSYTLQLSNTNPSNLLPTETDVGVLSSFRTFNGSLNTTNTADVYRFRLNSVSSQFNITLSGMSADADVRLIRDTNSNGVVDSGDELRRSSFSSNASELIRSPLAAGSYFVQVYRYSGNTSYNLSISSGDWYSNNLSDAGILGEARMAAGGGFSRNEMINILRTANDGGVVDATELTDLRRLLSGAGGLMPDYVRNLTGKVINGDPANPRSGIGNLFAGSNSTQMERLIGKWFLGTDRPAATNSTYRFVNGSLFQNGISYRDVDQGGVGDCYYMASLAAAAFRTPNTIQNMFIDNGDNTYTVRFFRNGAADYVTVDRFLPTNNTGRARYAGWGGGTFSDNNNELWVALAEKAYAQLNQSGWIGQNNTNSYAGIDGGWPRDAMRHVTGRNTDQRNVSTSILFWSSNDIGRIINTFNQGRMIALNTKTSGVDAGVVANHSYTMVGYNSTSDRFRFWNPHGSEVEFTRNQILRNFRNWDYTTN